MATMDNFTFGITLTIVGMGGTFLTLWILSALMNLLKKVCPITEEEKSQNKKD
jgi:Na+-transporting methylmalonyl-CoA/oxaloacetate decarboxylase gamma subunit